MMDDFIEFVGQYLNGGLAWSPWMMKTFPDEKQRDELVTHIRQLVTETMQRAVVLYKRDLTAILRQEVMSDMVGRN